MVRGLDFGKDWSRSWSPDLLHWIETVFVHPPKHYIPTKLVRIIPYQPFPGFLLNPRNNQLIYEPNFSASNAVETVVKPDDEENPDPKNPENLKKREFHFVHFPAGRHHVISLSTTNGNAPFLLYYKVGFKPVSWQRLFKWRKGTTEL